MAASLERFVSPPFQSIKESLSVDEIFLFGLLESNLPTDVEIYIKPQLNGFFTDFCLFSRVGVMPIIVCDWDLSAGQFAADKNLSAVNETTPDGKSVIHQSPINRLLVLRDLILDLFCARSEMSLSKLELIVCAGVIFTKASTQQALNLCRTIPKTEDPRGSEVWNGKNSSVRILGNDIFDNDSIHFIIPITQPWRAKWQSELVYKDVRSWLVEPEQRAINREPLELDLTQKRLVTDPSPPRYRRIRGPAGSGKSLILAARAQDLVNRGSRVLVVCFNITLLRWLQAYADRWAHQSPALDTPKLTNNSVTFLHYHGLLKWLCFDYLPLRLAYESIWREKNSIEEKTERTTELIDTALSRYPCHRKYDAILVDEGQDFLPSWWNLIRKLCRESGERLFVRDTTQDIYGRAPRWPENDWTGAGFSGQWINLEVSYRLPRSVADFALCFAQQFIPEKQVIQPRATQQMGLSLEKCVIKWENCYAPDGHYLELVTRAVIELLKQLEDGGSWPDITVIVTSRNFGWSLSQSLKKLKINTAHTFAGSDSAIFTRDEQQLERRKKVGFSLVSGVVKITTIASAKGLEARGIVVAIGPRDSLEKASLIYTAITRVKASPKGSGLVVINADDRFEAAEGLLEKNM